MKTVERGNEQNPGTPRPAASGSDPGALGTGMKDTSHYDTVVVGGGQAGLSMGYQLKRRGLPFVILDANERTGDGWRRRWDSLRLFTPARFSSLEGMPFPARHDHFPSKDEFAAYLESYARRHQLPIRHGARVDRLSHDGESFLLDVGNQRLSARQVVVAMANYQRPKVPAFAADLDPEIVQLHSSEYRNPGQLPASGDVLVVGLGNSGAEIALELAKKQRVLVAGRYPGHLPFEIDSRVGHALLIRLVLRVLFHRVLTVATPVGRKARPKLTRGSGPLIRTKAKHLEAAGVTRLPRLAGVRDGRPLLEDGTLLRVSSVVWCTGYRPGFEWIDLPVHDGGNPSEAHEPSHRRGFVANVPGLYFVGLHYLFAQSSAMIHGVGRDAQRVAKAIAANSLRSRSQALEQPVALGLGAAGVGYHRVDP